MTRKRKKRTPLEEARDRLNTTPWYRPLKRQNAARDYRYALLAAAVALAYLGATDG